MTDFETDPSPRIPNEPVYPNIAPSRSLALPRIALRQHSKHISVLEIIKPLPKNEKQQH
jgi:hypothetical protein